jgi:hypothetical protein
LKKSSGLAKMTFGTERSYSAKKRNIAVGSSPFEPAPKSSAATSKTPASEPRAEEKL